MTLPDELHIADISDLFGYEPNESDYARYATEKPHIIATAHKVQDVYETLSRARVFLWYLSNNEWGDFAKKDDEISMSFLKSQLVLSALLLYGATLDMSWQVVWANVQPSSIDYILDLKYMEQYKNCSRDSLLQQLDCAIACGGVYAQYDEVKRIVENFDKLPETTELRTWYNYAKHHGAIRFKGLGANPRHLAVTVNGQEIDVLHRKSVSIEELKETLLSYDRVFVPYIHRLIEKFIPADFKNKPMNGTDFIVGLMNCTR